MIIGIVGHEAKKFTLKTELEARTAIRSLLSPGDIVVSGKCHLGGIDVWAIDEAKAMGLDTQEFPPLVLQWSPPGGFHDRNIQIATFSEKVVCIVVKEYPDTYTDQKFNFCYHCKTNQHKKSGGCWTMKYAANVFGKPTQLIVI